MDGYYVVMLFSFIYGTKYCKDKTLRTKESMIKGMPKELRASIKELETI